LAVILATVILLVGEMFIFVQPHDSIPETRVVSCTDECVNDVIHNNSGVSC